MSRSITCPACQFEHARRPDGICPRCSQRVDPAPEPVLAPELIPLPRGARLAGVFLLVNALAVVAEAALHASSTMPGHTRIVAAIHDIVIGTMLMRGERKVLRWTIFRVCAGAAVFVSMGLTQSDYVGAGFQAAFSAALLMVLIGTPRRPRIVASVALFSMLMLVDTVALVGLAAGRNFLATPLLALRGELERAPERLTGAQRPWAMTTPRGWYLRPAAVAHKDNPLADRWLTRPDLDAHIMVISERIEGGLPLDPDVLARFVLENARRRSDRLEVIEQGTFPQPAGARMLHVVKTFDKMELELLYGLVASGSDAYQIVTFAPRRTFGDARPELEAAIASFVPAPR
jgi:hypothetical protein